MLLWVLVVYGGMLVSMVRQHLRTSAGTASAQAEWIAAAALLAGAGLAWNGLRALGPLLASPAEQSWGIATPVDRRAWLLPRFIALLLAGAFGAALATTAAAILALRGHELGTAAFAGAAWGVAGVASSIVAQRAREARRWPRLAGAALLIAGAAAAAELVAAHYASRPLPRPAAALGPGLAAVGAALAVATVAGALRGLRRLDRAALGAGAQIAEAVTAATVWVDPMLLSRVIEVRRWRRVGRVHSRRFLAVPAGRTWTLLQAELRRVVRRPGSLVGWAALALAQYAVGVVAPSMAGVTQVIGAYFVGGLFAGGLRAVARSPGLRRSLGGGEMAVRLAHLVLPALAAALWWGATMPAARAGAGGSEIALLAGVVAAVYRGATRGPVSYGSAVLDTPFGLFPIELVLQLARGFDILSLVIILRVLLVR